MILKKRIAIIMIIALIGTSFFPGAYPVYADTDQILVTGEDNLLISDEISDHINDTVICEETDNIVEMTEVLEQVEILQEDSTILVEEDVSLSDDNVLIENSDEYFPDTLELSGESTGNNVSINGIHYMITDKDWSATVIYWDGKGVLEIPSEITLDKSYESDWGDEETYVRKVVAIGSEAFKDNSDLTGIKIPSSVKSINKNAFQNCINLVSVELPSDMTLLGEYAFNGCTSLNSVKLPDKLDTIQICVFNGCTDLSSITIPKNLELNKVVVDDERNYTKGPFSGVPNLKEIRFEEGFDIIPARLFTACDSIENVDIPAGVTKVLDHAFINCKNLRSVTMTEDIESIGEASFQNCTSLEKIDLSKNTNNLGVRVFQGCTTLSECRIPDSVDNIGSYAFDNCKGLKSLTFFSGVSAKSKNGVIGEYAFRNCSALERIIIPNSFKEIKRSAYEKCTSLESMKLENRYPEVTFDIIIGDYAFKECSNLTEVIFENKIRLKSIGKEAYKLCINLTDLTFGEEVYLNSIGEEAFYMCNNLIDINIPNDVEFIGRSAFEKCLSLKNVTLPRNLKKLGAAVFREDTAIEKIEIPKNIDTVSVSKATDGIFSGCEKLKIITFEGGITKIPDNLFWGTGSLVNIDIPDGVTEVGLNAFRECVMLKNVKIPESVVGIADYAFYKDQNIVDLKDGSGLIPEGVQTIGKYSFDGCEALNTLILPDGIEKIGESAFANSGIQIAVIPESASDIGASCFEGCEELKEIQLPKNLNEIKNRLFYDCKKLYKVNLSEDILGSIGNSAFYNCNALESFDDSGKIDFSKFRVLKSIGKNAFQECDSLSSVTLSAATENIGEYVFDHCQKLSEINLGTGLSVIPKNAFSNLNSLVKMIVPRNVIEIKAGAFEYDPSFREIHIPKETTNIERGAFTKCDDLYTYVVDGSEAHKYSVKEGIKYELEVVYADSINYLPEKISINPNETNTPSLEILPVHYSVDVNYSSGNDEIFTVDKTTGKITAIKPGDAVLKASISANETGAEIEDTVEVHVKVPVTDITLNKTAVQMNVGERIRINATVLPENADNKEIVWTSSNEEIAYVNAKGMIYAKSKGNVSICAESKEYNIKKYCNVSITSILKDAPQTWTDTLNSPTVSPLAGIVNKGTRISINSEAAGASIYYTTDGSTPVADYTGRVAGTTRHYTMPVVINKNTTIRAFAICPGYKYSDVAEYEFVVDDGWGDIGSDLRSRFLNDPDKVPEGLWYVFDGDDNYYTQSGNTGVVKEYKGSSITFNSEIGVYYGCTKLIENRDYNISYKYNKAVAGLNDREVPTVSVKGKGNYKGKVAFGFEISAVDINKADIVSGTEATVISGNKISEVKPVIVYNGTILKERIDYTVVYYKDSKPVVAATKVGEGVYTAEIKAAAGSDYTGVMTRKIIIKAVENVAGKSVDMKYTTVTLPDIEWRKEGVDIKKLFDNSATDSPYAIVKYGSKSGEVLKYGVDYTVDDIDTTIYPDYPAAGKYIVRLHGTANNSSDGKFYVGEQTATLTISGIDASKISIGGINKKPVYTGNVITLSDLNDTDGKEFNEVTLYTGSDGVKTKLTEGTDYDVDMSAATDYGRFYVYFNLKGQYTGTKKIRIIVAKADINKATISTTDATYCKSGSVPQTYVSFDGKVLKEGIDYKISYSNNRKIGTANEPTVKLKGIGCFKGTAESTFKIYSTDISKLALSVKDIKYKEGKKGKYYKKTLRVVDDGRTVSKTKDILKYSYGDIKYYNAETGKEIGDEDAVNIGTVIEARVTITAREEGGYTGSGVVSGLYRVIDPQKYLSSAKVKVNDLVYANGEEVSVIKSSDITVTIGETVLNPSDYDIVSVTDNRFLGTAKIVIAGKGEYGGIKKCSVKINKKDL
ncbi:MAG: leucine-rich repeat protein [Lachnospiraceae bacterium]|nr:leucine-rich repeat protein [Lachnospiraceae bacterium]